MDERQFLLAVWQPSWRTTIRLSNPSWPLWAPRCFRLVLKSERGRGAGDLFPIDKRRRVLACTKKWIFTQPTQSPSSDARALAFTRWLIFGEWRVRMRVEFVFLLFINTKSWLCCEGSYRQASLRPCISQSHRTKPSCTPFFYFNCGHRHFCALPCPACIPISLTYRGCPPCLASPGYNPPSRHHQLTFSVDIVLLSSCWLCAK